MTTPTAKALPPSDGLARGDDVLLECRGVWKLYGDGLDRLASLPDSALTAETLVEHGVIGAVCDVSVSIRAGETFVVMGLSGSGKSTLVRCMTHLAPPTRGEVLLEGTSLESVTPAELVRIRRHGMGMVFQDFALLPHLTVLQNVAFPLRIQGASRQEREQRAHEMIELVGLRGRERNYPHELSGGQQQRVGIARSLTTHPKVWFLDEPFSALDPLIRHEMQSELLRLQEMLHKTIVFITHDFSEAVRLANRIAIMRDGRVVQVGTAEDLVLRPADPYVAKFTRDIPRARVLSAAAVMQPLAGVAPERESCVPADARIEAVAVRVMSADRPVGVVDADGNVVGLLDRVAVARVLTGGEAGE